MDADQFKEFLGTMKELMGKKHDHATEKENLNYKVFSGLDKFHGDESKWKEWLFNLKVAFGTQGQRFKAVLGNIEKDRPTGGARETIGRWRGEANAEGILDWFDKVGGNYLGNFVF